MVLVDQIQRQLNSLSPERQHQVLDFIVLLKQQTQETPADRDQERGERIKAAFQTLSKLNTFADIDDPVEWQRQLRQDRPLPGREK